MTGRLEGIGDKQYRLVSREKCFHKRGVIVGKQEIDSTALDELALTIEREMEAKGISPVFVFENPK
jgi:hypothetical protein